MIVGTGVDIVELDRIKQLLHRRKDAFIRRILTKQEMKQLSLKAGFREVEFVAGRFSAKESLAKALGTGIGITISWQDMSIISDETGRPVINLSAHAFSLLPPGSSVHVSISHSRLYCISQVIIESKKVVD